MAHLSVFFSWILRKWTASVIRLDWWAELMHSSCPMWVSYLPLSPPFLVHQTPLLAALGAAVCGLGRFSPLPSLLTFQPGLPPKCVFLVWNEIFTVRGPIYASQDTLSINHVACRCSPEYPVHSYDIRVLRVRSCEWHMGVALGVASPSLLRLTAIKLQAVLR